MRIFENNAYARTVFADELELRHIVEGLQLLAQQRRKDFANAIANGYTTTDGYAVEIAELAQIDEMAKVGMDFIDMQDEIV